MKIKLKNGQTVDLLNMKNTITLNQVDEKDISVFLKFDQNGDKKLTPTEMSGVTLAGDLYEDMSGFGTDERFHTNIKKLNKDKVLNVIKGYDERFSNSLIHDISREYEIGGLSLEDRVTYITEIKNYLFDYARSKNIDLDLDDLSKKFNTELEKQKNSTGVMNTKTLDEIFNTILKKLDTKNLNNYPQYKLQIATNEIFDFNNNDKDADIKGLINSFTPDELKQLTVEYENKGRDAGIPNWTNYEFNESYRATKRSASKWPQTLTQGIMNNKNLSIDERRELLYNIVDKACVYAQNNGIQSGRINALKNQANDFIKDCPFKNNSNTDMLNIWLDELFNKTGNDVTFKKSLRNKIIEENQ